MNWSSDENIERIYRLLHIKGFGPVQVNKILYKSKGQIQTSSDFEQYIIHTLTAQESDEYMREMVLYRSNRFSVHYASILDEDLYPNSLRDILSQRAPSVLSYIGNIDLLKKKKIAFSGSRKASEKGLWITRDCVKQLATDKDICIVSGYAAGIDITAHYAALNDGLSTIIVLPEGISHFTIHKELQPVWDLDRVLVISEFFPNDKWLEGRAMQRNKTIIGLCDAIVVVEAGEKGGSIDTGRQTLQLGKKLFVPQYAQPPVSALGNALLLQGGAQPLAMSPLTRQTNLAGLWHAIQIKQPHTLFG